MSIFDRFKRTENRANGMVEVDDPLLKAILGTEKVTKETALQIPTISGGINLIADIVAGTPIKLYRDNEGRAEEIADDPRVRLLNDETGDTLNANEFWHAIVRDYYLGKGGYAYINRSRGKIRSLHYVSEEHVSVNSLPDVIFKDFDILVNGQKYKPYDFLRILRNTKDGAKGTPITEENSRLIAVAYQSLLLEHGMIKRGGNKKGFLKSEKRVDNTEMDRLKEAFSNLYGTGSEDSYTNTIVLNNGMSFQETTNTPVEMQLNENKKTNANEFAKLFRISPDIISGKADDIDGLAKLAAIPLMVTIQCALNRDLLLEKEKGSLYWAFDTKELLKGAIKDRFEAYKMALEANFMQIDEVRYAEDLPPLDLNFVKLGLQDVLFDPKTKIIYTPNTNQAKAMNGNAAQFDLKGGDGDENRDQS